MNTNLEEIKKMAKNFLYLDYEFADTTGIGSLFLIHPIFESPYQMVNNVIVDITQDDEAYQELLRKYEKQFDKCKTVYNILFFFRKTYKLTFFHYINQFLSIEDFSKLLSDIWIESENPNMDVNVSIDQSARYFKKAKKEWMMTKEELSYYNTLPDEFTVYRGVANGRTENGLSWTNNKEKALWFANRFNIKEKKGYLLEGTVKKENVLAYFNRRDEDELVIHPQNIKNNK